MKPLALTAAAAAAVLLPAGPLGVGVPLVALLVAATAATAARPTLDSVLFGTLALGLAALAALRDAPWVITIDLVAAWFCLCAMAGGARIGALVGPVIRVFEAGPPVPTVPGGLRPAARGALLGTVLVVPFGALFWTADGAFAELGRSVPMPDTGILPGRAVAFVVVLAAAAGLAYAARSPVPVTIAGPARMLRRWDWALALAFLDGLFALFVAVQAAVLFGGRRHVLDTAGLSYAEYARHGFWQLLAVAGLTLVVIGATVRYAATPSRRDRVLLGFLLGLLAVLCIAVCVSALRRMHLYEDVYGLTRLRIAVEGSIVWLAAMLGLVVAAATVPPLRRHVARVATAGTAAGLILFSLANPDGIVAHRDVERWQATGKIDVAYLSGLSADAVPALEPLPPDLRAKTARPIVGRIDGDAPWSSFNLARRRALAASR